MTIIGLNYGGGESDAVQTMILYEDISKNCRVQTTEETRQVIYQGQFQV